MRPAPSWTGENYQSRAARFFNSSGALESFEDYDYGDVLRGLRALGVRYVIVQTDPALADANKGRANRRAIRGPAGADCYHP